MRWFYLRDANKRPVACIASEIVVANAGQEAVEYVYFAVSTHNPIDEFNRNTARDVAQGRLLSSLGEPGWDHENKVLVGPGVKEAILKKLASTKSMPQRTKDAAKLWVTEHPKRANSHNIKIAGVDINIDGEGSASFSVIQKAVSATSSE